MQDMKELESILDLNTKNVWSVTETDLASLWQKGLSSEEFKGKEEKLLNIIRLAFDVDHFETSSERENARYQKLGFIIVQTTKPQRSIALRKKAIKKITDLSYENIQHITAEKLLSLIENNFGGGWDSISLSIKDIIESAFYISTTTLPTTRLHLPGGMLEKKKEDGYAVLEIPKGTWTEAICAKKKDPIEKIRLTTNSSKAFDDEDEDLEDEDDDEMDERDDNEKDTPKKKKKVDEDEDEEIINDENFYGSFTPEADHNPTLDDLSEDL